LKHVVKFWQILYYILCFPYENPKGWPSTHSFTRKWQMLHQCPESDNAPFCCCVFFIGYLRRLQELYVFPRCKSYHHEQRNNGKLSVNALWAKKLSFCCWLLHWLLKMLKAPMEQSMVTLDRCIDSMSTIIMHNTTIANLLHQCESKNPVYSFLMAPLTVKHSQSSNWAIY